MSDRIIEERRDDQKDNVKRTITQEQKDRTRLADNYESFNRFMRQMYGGD